jgi:hypothetical protein
MMTGMVTTDREEIIMMTISLPPDIEDALAEAAQRLGTTPESLVLHSLRKLFISAPDMDSSPIQDRTLYDFLADSIGTVEGSTEAFSEDCGRRFADGPIGQL